MILKEREIVIPSGFGRRDIISFLSYRVSENLGPAELAIRFAVTNSNSNKWVCEIGVISKLSELSKENFPSIFDFRQRTVESNEAFNAVFLIPTGVGAEIGGHAGDATAAARLISEGCDKLILHPNVVNASDINELPVNSLYVEGSVLTQFLMGTVGLKPVRSNRVIAVIDDHPDEYFSDAAINSISAARATYGLDCPRVIKLTPPLEMWANYAKSGRAVGVVKGFDRCLEILHSQRDEFDAVAISSVIRVPQNYHLDYFDSEGRMVNPWGGVEAMLTHALSGFLKVPTAHSPMFEAREIETLEVGRVDPRMSAEAVSVSFLQCVLKGLHQSPGIIDDEREFGRRGVMSVEDVSCLITPDGCIGLPTLAALEQGIPVIAVRENKTLMENDLENLDWQSGKFFYAENYLEAAGIMNAIKAGVTVESVRRPIAATNVDPETKNAELPGDFREASGTIRK